jgi:cystathionine beta-synthase
MFDDEWMREMGFLESAWSETRASDILGSKAVHEMYTAKLQDRMTDVVARMKKHDISQLPVVSDDGKLVGMVSEVDLLNHLITNDHKHEPSETIEHVMRAEVARVAPDMPLEALMSIFVNGQVAVVVSDNKPVGILTKIDLLDYLSSREK